MPKATNHQVIIVAGPTASGKSALAMDIAEAHDGVIINADSMQVYKGIPIISACPSVEDKARVNHFLYEIYEPEINGTVVDWLKLAVMEICKAWEQGKLPVVVGGTGLYIDNLINGTTPIPETDSEIHAKVQKALAEKGVNQLHTELAQFDAESALRLSPNDTTRVSRAFEVYLQTGIPLSEWHKKPMKKKLPEAEFRIIKLNPPKEELDTRCYQRFDKMLQAGALDEVQKLAAKKLPDNLPAMKALGVPELLSYLKGEITFVEAVKLGKLHTRQYAKRQKTWFNGKLDAEFTLDECYSGNFDFSFSGI